MLCYDAFFHAAKLCITGRACTTHRRCASRSARNASPKKCAFACKGELFVGGPEGIRTLDPYNANVMRSQLRYRPMGYLCIIAQRENKVKKNLEGIWIL